jgi:hypothetical protein
MTPTLYTVTYRPRSYAGARSSRRSTGPIPKDQATKLVESLNAQGYPAKLVPFVETVSTHSQTVQLTMSAKGGA